MAGALKSVNMTDALETVAIKRQLEAEGLP